MKNNVDEELDLIEQNDKTVELLAATLTLSLKKPVERDDVFNALFMIWESKLDFDWMPDLLDIKINFDEAFNDLKTFDFDLFSHDIITDYSLIEDIKLYERKVLVKAAGTIWKIHLYDADPFPSSPHAHNLQECIKLDLSNGNCYRKKKYLKTIPKKDLLKIRGEAAKAFKGILPDLAV